MDSSLGVYAGFRLALKPSRGAAHDVRSYRAARVAQSVKKISILVIGIEDILTIRAGD